MCYICQTSIYGSPPTNCVAEEFGPNRQPCLLQEDVASLAYPDRFCHMAENSASTRAVEVDSSVCYGALGGIK